MIGLVIGIVVVVVVLVAGGVALALSGKRKYRAANRIVPGVDSSAPAEWAGAHTPEARLHRRLRDAVGGLSTHPRRSEPYFADLLASLQQQAFAVDEHLIAVAALPARVRPEPLAQVTTAVEAVEEATASLALALRPGAAPVGAETAELTERVRLVAEARAELDRLYPGIAASPPVELSPVAEPPAVPPPVAEPPVAEPRADLRRPDASAS